MDPCFQIVEIIIQNINFLIVFVPRKAGLFLFLHSGILIMDFNDFQLSLSKPTPPGDLSTYLQSLWYDGKGDWNKAHVVIQDMEGHTAAWIHAYLHRKEGDIGNADYWYRRADRSRPSYSFQKEWEEMVKVLL